MRSSRRIAAMRKGANCSGPKGQTLTNLLVKPGKSLLVVDVEGAEYDLLDQDAVPELRGADIIVELHEFARPSVTWRLLERFAYTHTIEIVSAQPDQAKVQAAIDNGMSVDQANICVREHRPLPQLWLRLIARETGLYAATRSVA